ncbi:MAG: general secretion pathway protein GspF [Gammaproteobacteria bacterium]|nr:general secretion pathway protein GspF [Gammaproteobacteria bacterium]
MSKYREQLRRAEAEHRRLEQKIAEACRKSGHARPKTRREFLNQGLIAGVSTVFLPSLATLLSRNAHAQDAACVIDGGGAGLGAGKIPFLGIDQGGGANIAGSNIMVGGVGGQEDFLDAAGYAKLGLPNAIIPQTVGVDRSFGIAMHPNSALLRGMLDKTSAATRANVNGVIIPARSENDTDENPHNPIYGIARAGASGEFAATIGTRNSDSGGRSVAPDSMVVDALRPVRVREASDAVGLGGGANEEGFPNGRVAEASAILSALKLGKITEQQATKDLVQCGFDKTTATFNTVVTPDDLNPNLDTNLQAIFPNGELDDGNFEKAAAAMKVVINGYAGAGTIEYGGRDYHQDPRPETDGKDFVVGQVIGAALEYAALQTQPLMLYLFSDGAVAADRNLQEDDGNGTTKFRWRSDNSQTAASAILVYSPNGQPVLRGDATATNQLGNFDNEGNVVTSSSPFANSVTALAEMVVLNYMGLHGEQANFGTVLNNPGIGTGAAVDPFIAFDPIV